MPTDDPNRGLATPRLEARILQTESDAYWLHVWLWEKGAGRRELLNGKRAASLQEAHAIIRDCALRHGAEPPAPDDIAVEPAPESD